MGEVVLFNASYFGGNNSGDSRIINNIEKSFIKNKSRFKITPLDITPELDIGEEVFYNEDQFYCLAIIKDLYYDREIKSFLYLIHVLHDNTYFPKIVLEISRTQKLSKELPPLQ